LKNKEFQVSIVLMCVESRGSTCVAKSGHVSLDKATNSAKGPAG